EILGRCCTRRARPAFGRYIPSRAHCGFEGTRTLPGEALSGEPKRVLFVCIGNSCRSQMAEAFARAYGSDVIVAASAGTHPAANVASDTLRAMAEKNLDLRDHFTKSIRNLSRTEFDLVVNMSGLDIPSDAPMKEWYVPDPI